MISGINYLLEGSLILILGSVFYFIFLKKEYHLQFRRGAILLILLAAMIIPLVYISGAGETIKPIKVTYSNEVFQAEPLQELVVSSENEVSYRSMTEMNMKYWLSIIYMTVTAGFLFRIIFQLLNLVYLRYSFGYQWDSKRNLKIVELKGSSKIFSFFGSIYMGSVNKLSDKEAEQVLDHESIHCKQYHAVDNIILELCLSIFWFIPSSWIFKKELKLLHEYIADREAVRNSDISSYSSLLSRITLKMNGIILADSFYQKPVFSRLNMIKMKFKPTNKFKITAFSMFFALTMIAFSCVDQVNESTSENGIDQFIKPVPEELTQTVIQFKNEVPEGIITYIEHSDDVEKLSAFVSTLPKGSLLFSKHFSEEGTIGMLINRKPENSEVSKEDIESKEIKISAQPLGGYPYYFKIIQNELKYPKEARDAGIEGKVFVEFVIDETGYPTEAKVTKGIDPILDEEAVRAVNSSTLWSVARHNGKVVSQKLILPITFKLN